MRSALVWTVLFSMSGCCLCARILAVFPFPGKSHYIFYSSVLKVLIQRGHEVVEYGPFPPKQPITNYTHVEVHTSLEDLISTFSYEDMKAMTKRGSFFGVGVFGLWMFIYNMCDEVFQHKSIKQLLESKDHFDLVITTSTFGQESMVMFGHKFNAPTVTLQAFLYSSTLNREAGNDLSIASVPDSMSFTFTNKMSFKERVQNFISVSLTLLLYYCFHLPRHDRLVKKYYQSPDMPSVADMVNNISLALVNSHPTVGYPQPNTPNIIPVSGVSLMPDRSELPQEIKKFMDSAKEGVIYFSFGTVVPAHTLPKKMLESFINAFTKLPQKVLWKIDTEHLPGLSSNVRLVKWVPQLGVLGHKNCLVFITHGGLFSHQEAIYTGVPTVGIPFMADQPFNIRFNEHNSIGVKLDIDNISEETIHSALKTVLTNPKYKENAQRLSRIFRDRPLSPADSVGYWVEYVLRHGGAHHLRPAAARLPWYQLTLLDVLSAILAALLAVLYSLYVVVRKIMFLVSRRNKKTKISVEKKKK